MKKILLFVIAVSLASIASARGAWCDSIPSELWGCNTCEILGDIDRTCERLMHQHLPATNCCWLDKNRLIKYGCTTDYYVHPNMFPSQCLERMGATPSEYPGLNGAKGAAKGNTKVNPKNTSKVTKSVNPNAASAKITTPAKSNAASKNQVVQKTNNSKQVAR